MILTPEELVEILEEHFPGSHSWQFVCKTKYPYEVPFLSHFSYEQDKLCKNCKVSISPDKEYCCQECTWE